MKIIENNFNKTHNGKCNKCGSIIEYSDSECDKIKRDFNTLKFKYCVTKYITCPACKRKTIIYQDFV